MVQMGMDTRKQPWKRLVACLSDDVVRSLAGNGTHPMCFAVALIVLLSTVQPEHDGF